jgi:hypothetical protein
MGEENRDLEYTDPEELEAQKKLAILQDQSHQGALFADWKNAWCTRKLFGWLDEQISDSRNKWLSAESREGAEAVRLEARAYKRIKTWIVAQILAGDMAAKGVKDLHEQGVKVEGLIVQPPPTQ